LVPSIIELVGKLFLVSGARLFFMSLRGGGIPTGDSMQSLILTTIGFAVCIPAEVWMTMRQLAYVRMLVNPGTEYDTAYKQVRHKFWAVVLYAIGFYVAFFMWVFIWAFLFGIAGFLAKSSSGVGVFMLPVILGMMVVAGISLVLILLPLTLVFVVLACEDKGFFAIIARSYAMTFKRFFPTVGFCIALFVTWLSVYMAMTSVLQIFYGAEYMRRGVYTGKTTAGEVQMPLYIQVIGGTWNSIVYIYLMPVFFVASGYYYYSLRTREEGLDMTHKLQLLEKKRDATSTA
jgi:hypothetical protein